MMNRSVMQRQMFANGGDVQPMVAPPSYISNPTMLPQTVEKFPDIYTGEQALDIERLPSDFLREIISAPQANKNEMIEAIVELDRRGELRGVPQYRSRELPEFEQQRESTRNVAASEDVPFEDRFFAEKMAKGGAAFPDYSGDGQITQKDILMGRGAIPKPMQMGGNPMAEPMPPMASEQMMPPMAEEPAMPMGVGEVDQQTVENVLTEVAKDVDDPEQAGSFEEMMNNVRGDDMPMNERRAELAAIVGPEDAARTPDSVLALLQPVLQLNSVDQGIGGLAEQEMQQPVEGDMAGGIMSMMGG